MTTPTTDRLAAALIEAGAPADMIAKAASGYYDDFKSPIPFPEMQLYRDALEHGLTTIAEGVRNGEWDATLEESEAWAASPDGQETFRKLVSGE